MARFTERPIERNGKTGWQFNSPELSLIVWKKDLNKARVGAMQIAAAVDALLENEDLAAMKHPTKPITAESEEEEP